MEPRTFPVFYSKICKLQIIWKGIKIRLSCSECMRQGYFRSQAVFCGRHLDQKILSTRPWTDCLTSGHAHAVNCGKHAGFSTRAWLMPAMQAKMTQSHTRAENRSKAPRSFIKPRTVCFEGACPWENGNESARKTTCRLHVYCCCAGTKMECHV